MNTGAVSKKPTKKAGNSTKACNSAKTSKVDSDKASGSDKSGEAGSDKAGKAGSAPDTLLGDSRQNSTVKTFTENDEVQVASETCPAARAGQNGRIVEAPTASTLVTVFLYETRVAVEMNRADLIKVAQIVQNRAPKTKPRRVLTTHLSNYAKTWRSANLSKSSNYQFMNGLIE